MYVTRISANWFECCDFLTTRTSELVRLLVQLNGTLLGTYELHRGALDGKASEAQEGRDRAKVGLVKLQSL